MNEVSAQTAALLLDVVEQRGLDAETLWARLPITTAQVRARAGRVPWSTWVEMMDRVEAACGPAELERLFVAGAGARTGHPFVRIANTFLSLHDVYALFARWGLGRHLMVMTARFEPRRDGRARFTVAIDPGQAGSLPTLRFVAGILRNLPTLHDLPPATVTIDPAATPHLATYDLVLPRERGLLSRARRVLRLAAGAAAALDELEQQATEIASQNQALARQLAETERAASELREREAWLGLALDAGRVGLWRWDPDTRRVWISEGLGQILGLPGDVEIETAIWTERIHPDDRARVAATMTDAIARGAPCQMEYRLVRPTGELSWVQTKGRAVPGAGGRTFQMFGTLADLSEQRLVDARLRLADRLIAAGTLAAGVAHEINNPLTYVLGNVDLIRMRLGDTASLTPAMLESLAQVREGLGRIRDVVADLRAFARPEQEQLVRVDVRTVADAAIRLVSSVVRHQAAVTTDYDADTPTVLVNESRLGQVLINLIVNASHAMPERPTSANSIVVRTRRRPSGEAAIEVVDNGSGIAPDLLPRLFDPFFTTKAPGEGTGLGLSVCQSIVTSMRGRIDIESTLGHGTTFAVVLPPAPPVAVTLVAGPAAPTAPPPAAPVAADGGPAPDARHRVLIIDDEPVVRRVVANMLADQGFAVVEASGGQAGIDHALAAEFDAIVCDLMMPGRDGVAVHDELTRRRPALATRMVFITGGAVSPRTRAFVDRPDVNVLPKPFSVDELVATLARLIATPPIG